ncbi:MAG: hypothetical protein OXG03_07670 [Gammaproteobacteria bacterium]|nr:hypothetical protein [Gammaproteobacteria bacterium]
MCAFLCTWHRIVLALVSITLGMLLFGVASADSGHSGNCNTITDLEDLVNCKVHRHEEHTGNAGAAMKWRAAERVLLGTADASDRALAGRLPKRFRDRILAAKSAAAPPVAGQEQEQEQENWPRAAQDEVAVPAVNVVGRGPDWIEVKAAPDSTFHPRTVRGYWFYLSPANEAICRDDGRTCFSDYNKSGNVRVKNPTFRFTGLTPDTEYGIVIVYGFTDFGQSRASPQLTVSTTPPLLPDTPGKVEQTVVSAGSIQVRVTWPGRALRGGYGQDPWISLAGDSNDGYVATAKRHPPSFSLWDQVSTSFRWTGLEPNTAYDVFANVVICTNGQSLCAPKFREFRKLRVKVTTLNASPPIRDPSIKVHRVTPTSIEVRAENLTGHPVRQTVAIRLWPASISFIGGCPFEIVAYRNPGATDVTLEPKGDLDNAYYNACEGMTSQVIAPGAVRFGGLKAGTEYKTQMNFTGTYVKIGNTLVPDVNKTVDFPATPISVRTKPAYATGHHLFLAAKGSTIVKEPANSQAPDTVRTFKVTYNNRRGSAPVENMLFQLCVTGTATRGRNANEGDYRMATDGGNPLVWDSNGCYDITMAIGDSYSRTFKLRVHHDDIDDADESIVLAIKTTSHTEAGTTTSKPIHWLITNDGPIPGSWLARMGHAIGGHAVDMAQERMRTPQAGLSGNWDSVSYAPEGASIAFWGEKDALSFDGHDSIDMGAGMETLALGVDYRRGDWLIGTGVASYSIDGYAGDYSQDASLKTVWPYASWDISEEHKVWGVFGTGAGRVRIDGKVKGTTDIDWTMLAVGSRSELAHGESWRAAVVTDLMYTRTRSENHREFRASDSETWRQRLGIDLQYSWFTGAMFLRRDGGDIASSFGGEFEFACDMELEHDLDLSLQASSTFGVDEHYSSLSMSLRRGYWSMEAETGKLFVGYNSNH